MTTRRQGIQQLPSGIFLGLGFAPALMVGPYFASFPLRNVVITSVLLIELAAFAFLLHFLIAFPKDEQPFENRKLLDDYIDDCRKGRR